MIEKRKRGKCISFCEGQKMKATRIPNGERGNGRPPQKKEGNLYPSSIGEKLEEEPSLLPGGTKEH